MVKSWVDIETDLIKSQHSPADISPDVQVAFNLYSRFFQEVLVLGKL